MKSLARELGFAFVSWFVPFALSVCMHPIQRQFPPLFDSLIGVVLAVNTAALACLYLRHAENRPLVAGLRIGVLWTLANWALDGLMFSTGPMKMSLLQYTMTIGVGYLMIPGITITLGIAAQRARAQGS